MDPKFTLQRNDYRPDGIFGELVGDNFTCKTGEHSYDNAPKIPPGEYVCVRGVHRLHHGDSFVTYMLMDVPGHTNCLLHVGNYPQVDSEGCILLGEYIVHEKDSGTCALMNSKIAFKNFMESAGDSERIRLIVLP